MTPSYDSQLANLDARVKNVEKMQEEHEKEDRENFRSIGDKVDGLKMWIMALLGSAIIELLVHGSALIQK